MSRLPFSADLDITAYELTPLGVWKLGVYVETKGDWRIYDVVEGLEEIYKSPEDAQAAIVKLIELGKDKSQESTPI